MPDRSRTCFLTAAALCILGIGAIFESDAAKAAEDALRNQLANKDCVRGHFGDYRLQGQGGDPPRIYAGRVFKLSQDYPNRLPPMEDYPWLKIAFKDGGPVDPEPIFRLC